MAKREYTIKLVLDDTLPVKHSSSTFSPRFDSDNEYIVNINMNAIDRPEDLTAHELGHVIGGIFKTPRYLGDPRVQGNSFDVFLMHEYGPTREQKEAMLASEREAWELAEKMIPVDQARKAWALGTYEKT